MTTDTILNESLECLIKHLKPKWGDRDLLDVFNRLLAKNIRPHNWMSNTHLDFKLDQITSRRELWSTEKLDELHRGHKQCKGGDFDCPIVIVEYKDQERVLDGNTRINRWVANGDTRDHNVNFHTITFAGDYVELPSLIIEA